MNGGVNLLHPSSGACTAVCDSIDIPKSAKRFRLASDRYSGASVVEYRQCGPGKAENVLFDCCSGWMGEYSFCIWLYELVLLSAMVLILLKVLDALKSPYTGIAPP